VLKIDDLIEPRAEQILLAGLALLAWTHEKSPWPKHFEPRESRIRFARNPPHTQHFPAKSITPQAEIAQRRQRLQNTSLTTR
jgi:hypothetical protein